ncbi:MAG TPA: M4 family metallopeptidase, partial [Chitinophagales bacterium]|nr:M4 family metallopeptidase [Chitinophagales bacterium]
VEWYADSTVANWLIGEDIGAPFRSMSNPNTYGDPDTYGGTNWYTGTGDNGGVHINSGVQNHWYYRLSVGGTGTNDIGNAYNVTAIGRNKATRIAWRNDVVYLTSTSDYADARFYAIQSANDLYGVCSQEAISTTRAWYAVGVGPDFVYGTDAQFTASPVSGCTAPFTVTFNNTSTNASAYSWTFGDGGTSTALSPTYTYNALGTYTVKLVTSGSCGVDSLLRTNYISVSTSNPCVVIMPVSGTYQTQTACTGTIYDNGGTANYTDNTNSVVTIAPTGASQVRLHFTQFNMENTYDFVYVYDGPTTASPVIASFTGTTIPADVVSSGSSITIRQYSDQSVVAAGFTIQWTCINPNAPPTANFKADVTQSCSGGVKFTDLTVGGPNAWLWNFGDGATSTQQHPIHNYLTNGTFTVSLQATNNFGNNTATKTNYITITKPAGPAATGGSNCGPQAFTLSTASANPVTWFDSAGNVVSAANPFTTPVLNNTTVYYVQDTQPQPIYKVGPLSNAIGSGSNYNSNQTRALRFRVFKKSKLVSVLVYAQGDGYRTVQHRDSLGGVITNKTIFIPNGSSRITLNLDLVPGTYELGLRDTMNLYRNSTGAVYPYNDANGIVSIYGNNAANSATYYYYFYDWEVKEAD